MRKKVVAPPEKFDWVKYGKLVLHYFLERLFEIRNDEQDFAGLLLHDKNSEVLLQQDTEEDKEPEALSIDDKMPRLQIGSYKNYLPSLRLFFKDSPYSIDSLKTDPTINDFLVSKHGPNHPSQFVMPRNDRGDELNLDKLYDYIIFVVLAQGRDPSFSDLASLGIEYGHFKCDELAFIFKGISSYLLQDTDFKIFSDNIRKMFILMRLYIERHKSEQADLMASLNSRVDTEFKSPFVALVIVMKVRQSADKAIVQQDLLRVFSTNIPQQLIEFFIENFSSINNYLSDLIIDDESGGIMPHLLNSIAIVIKGCSILESKPPLFRSRSAPAVVTGVSSTIESVPSPRSHSCSPGRYNSGSRYPSSPSLCTTGSQVLAAFDEEDEDEDEEDNNDCLGLAP